MADKNNIEYWNFNLYKGDIGLSMDCYSDGAHLNGKGAEIYTKFFCDFVNEINNNNDGSIQYFNASYRSDN
jgi:hypothetical protein